jgi:hypothetical protein
MYQLNIKWYDKKQVLSIFPITERTYFSKIKYMDKGVIRQKKVKNRRGKPSTLIYYADLDKVFGKYRRPKDINNIKTKRKYIGTTKWDIIGNIVPENASVPVIKLYMNCLIKHMVKQKINKDWFFYSVEKNPNDKFYHAHFLIKTEMKRPQILEILKFLCNTNKKTKDRIWVDGYDFPKHQYSGSFYSFKTNLDEKGGGCVYHDLI